MSTTALRWAVQQQPGLPQIKAMLIALAWEANSDGEVIATQSELGAILSVSDRLVRHTLTVMESLGIISRRKRTNGGGARLADAIQLPLTATIHLDRRSAARAWSRKSLSPTGTRHPGGVENSSKRTPRKGCSKTPGRGVPGIVQSNGSTATAAENEIPIQEGSVLFTPKFEITEVVPVARGFGRAKKGGVA